MFMHMQIEHKNTPLVCRKFLSPGCAPKKKIIFSCPVYTLSKATHCFGIAFPAIRGKAFNRAGFFQDIISNSPVA